MKKALIVTTVSGFVPQFEMNNVKILQEMGYEVHYASNFHNVSYGMDNQRLNGTGIICHQVDFVRSPFEFKENLKAFRQLKQVAKEGNYSLVHCHTPVGAALTRLVYAKMRRKKLDFRLIYTAHGFHFYKGAPLKYWILFYPIERFLARYTDVLITINKEDYERAKRFCRHKKVKVEYVLGVGIDTNYWSGKDLTSKEREEIRKKTRKELAVLDSEKMLLSIGELIPRKNHSSVIEALAKWKESQKETQGKPIKVRYFICGHGVLQDKLQKMIREKNLEDCVTLLGYRTDIRNLLYAADLFVFPSKQEGLPVALLEAIAAGVEVKASNIRGNRDLCKISEEELQVYDKENIKQRMRGILEQL